MLCLAPSGRFKRDMKRAAKRGKDIRKIAAVIDLLLAGHPLPASLGDIENIWRFERHNVHQATF